MGVSEDKYQALEDDGQSEKALTVEDIINRTVAVKRTWWCMVKFVALFMTGIGAKMVGPMMIGLPIFAGFLNYKSWECVSEVCVNLSRNATTEDFYTRKTICDNGWAAPEDIRWLGNRTSFGLEWGLICGNEGKGSNLRSFFFIGGFVGLLVATTMFDAIGRKLTTLFGLVVVCISTLVSGFANGYTTMLPLRVIHGFGAFIVTTGVDLLTVEFVPTDLRNLSQLISSLFWMIGSLVLIAISYGILQWRNICYTLSGVFALFFLIVLILPESPRFQLVKGKEAQARKTFNKIAWIFNTHPLSKDTKIIFQDYKNNYWKQLKDFRKYPLMQKNTLILMVSWMSIACISYGLLFSWAKLGSDIYTNILFSTIGSFIAHGAGIVYFTIQYLGRKKASVVFFLGLGLTFYTSIPCFGVKVTDGWTLDNIVCLLSTVFISGVWGSVVLLTKELSPTSHRGMIYCLASSSGRLGSFVGPYSALLYNEIEPRIVLGIFGTIAALAAIMACFNSDSTGKPIPSTPADVVKHTGHTKIEDDELDN